MLSSLQEQEEAESLPEVEEDSESQPKVIGLQTASEYLTGLRDFAVAHCKPDMLNFVSKSQNIVEELLWEQTRKAKQTKLTDFFTAV